MLVVFLHGCFGFLLLFLFIIMFSFGCLAPVKRLAGKIVCEMASNVSVGTLNPTQQNLCRLWRDRISCYWKN